MRIVLYTIVVKTNYIHNCTWFRIIIIECIHYSGQVRIFSSKKENFKEDQNYNHLLFDLPLLQFNMECNLNQIYFTKSTLNLPIKRYWKFSKQQVPFFIMSAQIYISLLVSNFWHLLYKRWTIFSFNTFKYKCLYNMKYLVIDMMDGGNLVLKEITIGIDWLWIWIAWKFVGPMTLFQFHGNYVTNQSPYKEPLFKTFL